MRVISYLSIALVLFVGSTRLIVRAIPQAVADSKPIAPVTNEKPPVPGNPTTGAPARPEPSLLERAQETLKSVVSPLPPGTSVPKADAAPDVEVPMNPDSEFIYDPAGKRDPFKSYFADEVPTSNAEGTVVVDSLESYDLGQLKLTAILWGTSNPKAMIRSPTGKVFLVRKRTKMGRNKGFVAEIREGELVVFELSQDGKTPSTRIMTLQK